MSKTRKHYSALKSPAIISATISLFISTGLAAQAEGYITPKTQWGTPDLQGTWSSASITNLTRPRGVDKLTVTVDEALELERSNIWNSIGSTQNNTDAVTLPESGASAAAFNTRGYNYFWIDPGTHLGLVGDEIRTSWIVEPENGQIPYKENGRQMQRNPADVPRMGSFDGPETRPLAERCLLSFSNAGGPVMLNGLYNNTYQIVQNEDYVMILVEMVHDARIIRIDKEHRSDGINRWLGDSVGWYEGDTLVVETINPNPVQRAFITPAGKVTERFTRWSDDQITYEFTVEDETLYTQPWKGELGFYESPEPLYEYACHEGNHAFPGILGGARRQEQDGLEVEENNEVEQ